MAGSLIIDRGAVEALKNKGTSLLPVGIISYSGRFEKGDLISCFDDKENEINQDEPKVNEKSNFFENVEYNGIDLNGNRYIVKSEFAEFESDFPELIKMTNMTAIFYFSDGSSIKSSSYIQNSNNFRCGEIEFY